ncbi:MAG: ATP-binding protein, partial [Bdellovibrionales bacterium]|nr:ATP-binding protein [Bdellovibrionales bacterium]
LKDARKMPLAAVELDDCFKEVSFLFEQSLKNKQISLEFKNNLSPNTKVMADQTSLVHSVLSNLVSNGIKFTSPHSKIVITAHEKAKNIILEVRDEGPGISQEMIADIMQNKELISSEGTMGEKGTGLGLSIVKSYVDSYGGQMEIDSSFMLAQTTKQGTNFRITLDKA